MMEAKTLIRLRGCAAEYADRLCHKTHFYIKCFKCYEFIKIKYIEAILLNQFHPRKFSEKSTPWENLPFDYFNQVRKSFITLSLPHYIRLNQCNISWIYYINWWYFPYFCPSHRWLVLFIKPLLITRIC